MDLRQCNDLYVFLSGVRNGIETLGLAVAVRFAVFSVPKHLRRQAERIAQRVEGGMYLFKALMQEGFDKKFCMQLKMFELSGAIKEGLDSGLRQLEKLIEIQSELRKIDRDIYIISGLLMIASVVLVFFYFPNLVERLLEPLGDPEVLRKDKVIWFLYNFFSGASFWKKLMVVIGICGGIFMMFFVLKVHRFFLKVVPSFRRMLIENDKVLVLTLLLTSFNAEVAVNILEGLFQNRYNFSKVRRRFVEINFKAFKDCTLFDENEKNLFMNVAETGNLKILEVLLKKSELTRKQLVANVVSVMNVVKLIIGALFVIGLYGLMMYMVYKLQGLIRG